MARATGRAVDSSVSLGASRQRPVCHETRCRPGADPAPCLRARRHVLLRDLHLANHGQLRPARRPPSRMGSSGWCSPTRPPLLPLLPSISTSVLRALQRAQKLQPQSRNRLGSSRFRLPGHCSNRRSRTALHVPKSDHTVRVPPTTRPRVDETAAVPRLCGSYRDHTNNRERTELENPVSGRFSRTYTVRTRPW